MKKSGIAKPKVKIRAFHKDRLAGDMRPQLLLSAFYGIETAQLFGWSVEHRYGQMTQAQHMMQAGYSRMYYAQDDDGMPMGMLIATKTNKPKIKRMDAIYVFEPYRGSGIAGMLLEEARAGGDLHSFSAPSAVAWHEKHGFRNLGPKVSEGTVEMFTGAYKPVYDFSYTMPIPNEHDWNAIRQLEEMERHMLSGRPG